MAKCTVAGCEREVSKPGFKLCYPCWKKQNGKDSSKSASSSNSDGEMLNATKIGQELGISGQKLNLLFNELGWTYKPRHGKGWTATKQGKKQGKELSGMMITWSKFIIIQM